MTKEERAALELQRLYEMKSNEDELRKKGYKYIAGIDEVGRGPLAGPVYAACVVLPEDFGVPGINDSKKLSEKKRVELDKVIKEKAISYGIGISTNEEIDEINILNATKNAMLRAIDEAQRKLPEGENIDMILVDAVNLDTDIEQKSIIKGDQKSLSIAAASIIAKVARDNYMVMMDEEYPGYAFASNKGYGTKDHYKGLRELGYTKIHRRSFLKKFEEENKKVAKGKKFYAVKNGRECGIFDTWDECKRQVEGFSSAEYKSFPTLEDARQYLGLAAAKEKPTDCTGAQVNGAAHGDCIGAVVSGAAPTGCIGAQANCAAPCDCACEELDAPEKSGATIYVDGSYNIKTKKYSGAAVILNGGEVIELSSAYDDEQAKLRNVAGEIMGVVLAVNYCHKNGIKELIICHDYEGLAKWADNLWKANLPMTIRYKDFIARARKKMKISFKKVKAHSGNKYNERADALAKAELGM